MSSWWGCSGGKRRIQREPCGASEKQGLKSLKAQSAPDPFPHLGGRWPAEPVGWGPVSGAADGGQDMAWSTEYVGVGEAENGESLRGRPGITPSVVEGSKRVNATVDLDDQAGGKAGEIDDEGADRNLAAESKAGQLAVAEMRPENFFRAGRRLAQAAGSPDRRIRLHRRSPHPSRFARHLPPRWGKESVVRSQPTSNRSSCFFMSAGTRNRLSSRRRRLAPSRP